MKQFIISGVPFSIKDELKNIRPICWQKWQYSKEKWTLTIQTAQSTKRFEKELKSFASTHNLTLEQSEWDGTNKDNNYGN